ncbi:MAG: segregation/condensation protein A [Bacillota bacterium]|nr:segregation/condensation protein A [Bacillota bacterium]
MNYAVRLSVFEGPLDLLLHLVEANRVDVYDIPVAQIAEQYLQYLAALSAVDVDAAAEFVVMAATLLEIKARMLLPRPPVPAQPQEPDPRQDLVERLVVYRKFKQAGAYLEELMARQGRCYLRGGKTPAGEVAAGELAVSRLLEMLRALLKQRAPVMEVARRRVSVRQKMREIVWRLRRSPAGIRFGNLLPPGAGREQVVVTFLALLELLRLRRIAVRQEGLFGEILVFPAGRGMPGADGRRPGAVPANA